MNANERAWRFQGIDVVLDVILEESGALSVNGTSPQIPGSGSSYSAAPLP